MVVNNFKSITPGFNPFSLTDFIKLARTPKGLANFMKSVRENGLNPGVMDLKLMTTIAKESRVYKEEPYEALRRLAEAVKDGGLNPSVLDPQLLLTIAKNRNVGETY